MAIEVPVLSCASIWLRVQKEAEEWITSGGKLIEDPIARNRRINAAYAQLWLADRRFQWAGLAAFASKQVGCGLLHAAENIQKSHAEIEANLRRHDIRNSSDAAASVFLPSSANAGSAYMYGQLALGNTLLFLDIYPIHRFFMLRGLKQLLSCISDRSKIQKEILWPIASDKLKFGGDFREILVAFRQINDNKISDSVETLAKHEQINILQAAIYNDFAMHRALDANQLSLVTGIPSGYAAEIQLTLSSECRSKSPTFGVFFSKDCRAKLYDPAQRMPFVIRAAKRFDELLKGPEKNHLEASVNDIAYAGSKE